MDLERDVLGTAANVMWLLTIVVAFGSFILIAVELPDTAGRFIFAGLASFIGSALLVSGLANRNHWFRKAVFCAFIWSCGLALTLSGSAT